MVILVTPDFATQILFPLSQLGHPTGLLGNNPSTTLSPYVSVGSSSSQPAKTEHMTQTGQSEHCISLVTVTGSHVNM